MDKHGYKGWMNSDKLWKRALGVTLHNWLGQLIVSAIFISIALILAIIVAVLKAIVG